MSPDERWIAAALTIAVLALYEIWFALAQRRNPGLLARSAHASLREDWFVAVSRQPGSEVHAGFVGAMPVGSEARRSDRPSRRPLIIS